MDKDVYTKKLRNQVNNAKMGQNVLNMAKNAPDPRIRAIGKAASAADKLTGGKLSSKLGKKLPSIVSPPGPGKFTKGLKAASALASNIANNRKKQEYSNEDPTEVDFNATVKKPLIVIGAFAIAGFLIVGVVSCLLISLIFVMPTFDLLDDSNKTLDLENYSDEEIDKKFDNIEKKIEDKYGFLESNEEDEYVININYSDKSQLKLVSDEEDEYIQKMIDRYSSSISDIEDYDEKVAYRFFSKLYYIEKYYAQNYSVALDMPLLMATLKVQSEDLGEVFSSNVVWYERMLKTSNPNYSYTKDWSSYIPTKNESSHDIELLCQHMVSNSVKEYCVNSSGNETKSEENLDYSEPTITCDEGETYKTKSLGYKVNRDKYREFLYLFLETKYFSDTKDLKFDWDQAKDNPGTSTGTSDNGSDDGGNSQDNGGNSSTTNELARAMLRLANSELENNGGANGGLKYRKAYGIGESAWCAIFVWYISANTTVNGVSIYPDIVAHKSNSTGSYMRWFVDHKSSNIKFYYNDSCKYYKNKNGTGVKYTPKPGDYVFFDWSPSVAWTYSNDVQDHIGLVESYTDGTLRTIEGNLSNTIMKLNRGTLDNCEIIGFGSWY